MDSLKCISANIRGLNSKEKRKKFFSWILDTNIDICFIQETHFVSKNSFQYNCNWPGESIHAFSDSVFSRGVSILLKKNSNIEVLDIHKSLDGRKLLVNICVNEENLTLVNIYAPNKESNRVDFFKRLTTFINIHALSQSRLVLCGDFNCNINSKTDKSAKILRDCINTLDIKDLWHTIHKNRDGFTWCDASDTPKK